MENKTTRGRQKITIQRIESKKNMLATFSKRKLGIYRKASQLCTSFDVQIGVVVFSPNNIPHSFFHPSVESIVEPILFPSQNIDEQVRLHEVDQCQSNTNKLHGLIDRLRSSIKFHMEREAKIDKLLEETRNSEGWNEKPIEELEHEELIREASFLRNIQIQILMRKEKLQNQAFPSFSSSIPLEKLPIFSPQNIQEKSQIPFSDHSEINENIFSALFSPMLKETIPYILFDPPSSTIPLEKMPLYFPPQNIQEKSRNPSSYHNEILEKIESTLFSPMPEEMTPNVPFDPHKLGEPQNEIAPDSSLDFQNQNHSEGIRENMYPSSAAFPQSSVRCTTTRHPNETLEDVPCSLSEHANEETMVNFDSSLSIFLEDDTNFHF